MKNVLANSASLIAVALSLSATALELTPQQLATAKLSTTEVVERQIGDAVTVNGTLRADQQRLFRVAPVVDGVVTELKAVEYGTVAKGQSLATLRSNTLGQARADYLEALARFDVVESEFQRVQKLRKDGVVADSRLLEAESNYKTARIMLDQRRRALSLAGLSETQIKTPIDNPDDIAYYALVSPADGVVLDMSAEIGQMLEAGETAFRLADLTVLWADVHIPVANVNQVVLGSDVAIRAAGYPGRVFTGQLQAVSGEVDSQSQTVTGRVVIDNRNLLLRPGTYVQVELKGPVQSVSMVPESAVFRRGNDNYLFKVTGANTFEPVKVVVGQPANGWVRVESGVAAGTEIVSAGVAELKSHWQYQGSE